MEENTHGNRIRWGSHWGCGEKGVRHNEWSLVKAPNAVDWRLELKGGSLYYTRSPYCLTCEAFQGVTLLQVGTESRLLQCQQSSNFL